MKCFKVVLRSPISLANEKEKAFLTFATFCKADPLLSMVKI